MGRRRLQPYYAIYLTRASCPATDGGLVMNPHAKKPSSYRKLIRTIGLLVLALCSSSSAWAQLRIVGAVSGTVQDPTGAVVADAKIKLKDAKTGVIKETTS